VRRSTVVLKLAALMDENFGPLGTKIDRKIGLKMISKIGTIKKISAA
jgi:hypothetical protein